MGNNAMEIRWDLESLKDIEASLQAMEGNANRMAATASAKAAKKELLAVQTAAPVRTGALRRGLILVAEHNRRKGKQVYQVVPTRAMNSIFQKIVKHPGTAPDGKNRRKIAYYPAAQEFGFAKKNGGFVPGKHYMQDTLAKTSSRLAAEMEQDIMKSMDKEWK